MHKGMYVAMSGATLRSRELDTIANNLANASTIGYKRESFSASSYSVVARDMQKAASLYPAARVMTIDSGKMFVDESPGIMKSTGNPLDLAISGNGFFAVEGQGRTLYTRNGVFSLDSEGYLVTAGGQKVLDTGDRPLRINDGGPVTVSPDGTVNSGNSPVGKLKVVKVDTPRHVGSSLFSGKEAGDTDGEVLQGTLELSNVNPVIEMVSIIHAMREYEAAQRIIKNFDELASRTVTDIAKV
ncbi:MAG: flagellar basal-body rod protein FlgF [Alphaproteobacteria bacterium]|uniref:Flagellar basal-body rod protein FlgF n=1 Tax=Candidatus Nitrobium versatile TaxID=2884831 RepID=A0A953M178_9BACT|nr:flagellar basal-body rod protein FlgF [Candidatus Nitrobium versatile]